MLSASPWTTMVRMRGPPSAALRDFRGRRPRGTASPRIAANADGRSAAVSGAVGRGTAVGAIGRGTGIFAGDRELGCLAVQSVLSLLVKPLDLFLEFIGSGQQGLVQLGGDVDARPGALVVLTGLPRDAHVDR